MSAVHDDFATAAFDEAVRIRLADKRSKFAANHGRGFFSDETTDTLQAKARLVKEQMDQGVGFFEACDSPDVYLGYLDREYVSHYLQCVRIGLDFLDLQTFRKNRLVADALTFLSRTSQ